MNHLLLMPLQIYCGGKFFNALGLTTRANQSCLLQGRCLFHVELTSRGERQFAVRYVLYFLMLD